MGYSTTPTYRLEFKTFPQADGRRFSHTPATWRTRGSGQIRGDGAPSDRNLAAWVHKFEQSTRTGANKHLGAETISSAKIIRQSDGNVVANYAGPMFAVIGQSRTKSRAARRRGER